MHVDGGWLGRCQPMPADAGGCRVDAGWWRDFLPYDRLANVGQESDAPAGTAGLGRSFSRARTQRHRAPAWAEMPPDPAQRSPCEDKAGSRGPVGGPPLAAASGRLGPRLIRTASSGASTDGDFAAEGPLAPACSKEPRHEHTVHSWAWRNRAGDLGAGRHGL
jgi:hypothetical protein